MDIRLIDGDDRFAFRVSALIYNKDLTKILLFNVEGRDWYMLPGGKVKIGETGAEAIKREILEELGYYINFSLLGVSEEFGNSTKYNNHQLNLIFKGVFDGEDVDYDFHGFEGDWATYKWVNISDINEYEIFPGQIKDIINTNSDFVHFITKDK